MILINGTIQHKNPLKPSGGITTVKFERNEYSFSEFLPQSETFNLDSSQRYINELLFPDEDDPYVTKRINNFFLSSEMSSGPKPSEGCWVVASGAY